MDLFAPEAVGDVLAAPPRPAECLCFNYACQLWQAEEAGAVLG